MQLILRCETTVEEYVLGEHQKSVPPPRACPHCKQRTCLKALGYYERGVTATNTGRILLVSVRRFRCRHSGRTVSLLPAFAHPYRLVASVGIESFFSGHRRDLAVQWWTALLQRYWKRFEFWLPGLLDSMGNTVGLSPPIHNHAVAWKILRRRLGPVPDMTRRLVGDFQVTIFGRYQCHSAVPLKPRP